MGAQALLTSPAPKMGIISCGSLGLLKLGLFCCMIGLLISICSSSGGHLYAHEFSISPKMMVFIFYFLSNEPV